MIETKIQKKKHICPYGKKYILTGKLFAEKKVLYNFIQSHHHHRYLRIDILCSKYR